jgi:hypothetical protein
MNTVHNLQDLTMREAYDYTQYSSEVKDGDILLVEDGVGVMVEAWPIMAVGQSIVFHKAAPDFHELTDNKYLESFAKAGQPVQQLLHVAITAE